MEKTKRDVLRERMAKAIATAVEEIAPDTLVLRRPLPVTNSGLAILPGSPATPLWHHYMRAADAALGVFERNRLRIDADLDAFIEGVQHDAILVTAWEKRMADEIMRLRGEVASRYSI